MSDTATNTYLYDHVWEPERLRLASLAAELDPGTIRHLDALGVGAGWRCWEVGAGSGSVARWLAARVGATGHVLASDIDTLLLADSAAPNLTVLRHDIRGDPLPAEAFDLVHVRALLCWLPAPRAVLARLAQALRPGGWLLVEEPDLVTLYHASQPAALRTVVTAALRAVELLSGADFAYGRQLFDDVRAQGLVATEAEGRMQMIRGDRPLSAATFVRLSIERVRGRLLATGAITAEEVEETMRLLRDPAFATVFMMTISAWGQRPLQGAGSVAPYPWDDRRG